MPRRRHAAGGQRRRHLEVLPAARPQAVGGLRQHGNPFAILRAPRHENGHRSNVRFIGNGEKRVQVRETRHDPHRGGQAAERRRHGRRQDHGHPHARQRVPHQRRVFRPPACRAQIPRSHALASPLRMAPPQRRSEQSRQVLGVSRNALGQGAPSRNQRCHGGMPPHGRGSARPAAGPQARPAGTASSESPGPRTPRPDSRSTAARNRSATRGPVKSSPEKESVSKGKGSSRSARSQWSAPQQPDPGLASPQYATSDAEHVHIPAPCGGRENIMSAKAMRMAGFRGVARGRL